MTERRGGRQYQLPRVRTTQLSPGLRTVLTQFESAIVQHVNQRNLVDDLTMMDGEGEVPQKELDMLQALEEHRDSAKQAIIRKLLRMQNGEEFVDVEELKRQMRLLTRTLYNITQAPEQATQIIEASKVTLESIERIIGRRRSW